MTKEPEPKLKKRIFRSRARVKKAKLGELNIPDTSISFFEDVGLYRKPIPKASKKADKKALTYRSRRKAQFSK